MSSVAPSPAAVRSARRFGLAGFSAEFQLVLACCELSNRESRRRELQAQVEGSVDWRHVLRIAEHHNVLPLLYRALRGFPGVVPSTTLDELRDHYALNAQRNLRFTAELFRVLDCLEAHAIPAIPFKGPVLAETVYGDLALRSFSDLDVLVRPADVLRAKAALATLGYTPSAQLPPAMERAYVATGYEYSFDGPAGRNLLEIQWGILPRFYAVQFDCDALFDRSGLTKVSGRTVHTLSPEDLLLVLCAHAAKHAWVRLGWLRDIAGVLQHPADWSLVEQHARELGICRIVAVSLLLTHRLFGASIPDSLRELGRADHEAEPLSEQIARDLPGAEEHNSESLQYFRLMLRLRERTRDQLRFLFRLSVTPSIGEWALVRLPGPLFPVYRIIRLFRLGTRLAGSLRGSI